MTKVTQIRRFFSGSVNLPLSLHLSILALSSSASFVCLLASTCATRFYLSPFYHFFSASLSLQLVSFPILLEPISFPSLLSLSAPPPSLLRA